jgi:hypothetical protein
MNAMASGRFYFQHFDLLIELYRAGHQEALVVIKAQALRDGLVRDYGAFPNGLDAKHWLPLTPRI